MSKETKNNGCGLYILIISVFIVLNLLISYTNINPIQAIAGTFILFSIIGGLCYRN